MSRNRVPAGLTSTLLAAGLLAVAAPAAQAAIPECFGKKATIVGTGQDDTLKGTSRDDVIVAKGGSDLVFGNGGNDLLCGSAGQDYIRGDGGKDKLNGGKGQDKVYYTSASRGVTINLASSRASGGSGTDVLKGFEDIVGSHYSDNITGSNTANLISALGGDDTISGGGGLDILEGSVGNDILNGGNVADIDIAWYDTSFATEGSTGPVTVDLSIGTATDPDGTDTLTNIDTVVGSMFDDQLTGDPGDNFILGMAGDDTIDGAGGFDVSIYWFASGAVTANLQAGTSTGGDGNDSLTSIEGLNGSDFDDQLVGNNEDNFLDGSAGNDSMDGGAGADWIMGGDGRDQINGGANNQSYDLVDYEAHFGGPINANLQTGLVTGVGNDSNPSDDTINGVEGIFGTLFDDTITGDGSNNILFGWTGFDTIIGAGGDDALDGGVGYFDVNFTYHESGEIDSVDGGVGMDSCSTAETPTACEGETPPPNHPLTADAQATISFRRPHS